jgi:formate hydrogenlyase subunit 6/NADH:ubiquinone oxidoreductase subunit I
MASGFLTDLIRSFTFGLIGRTSTITKASQVEVPTNFRGVPVLDPEKCILCGRCGKVCPAGAITLSTTPTAKSVRIFVGHCIFCSECSMICPVSAITMTNIWETAVTNRLSMDTMNTREIKRKVKKKVIKAATGEMISEESKAEIAKEELECEQPSGEDLIES